MGLKRRTFLQQAGLALAALGASETALSILADKSFAVPLLDRYYQALAQTNGRKLALLVGINQYPRSAALGGCVTDVELQRELLIHRFGFKPGDILSVTDKEATRQNIETAFLEHLTNQAREGDVVLFHFSGYGSRVKMMDASGIDVPQEENSLIQNSIPKQSLGTSKIQNSLVPVDGVLSAKETQGVNDLLEETLILLLRSLATDQVTTVLDTSYTDPGTVVQSNLRIRSRASLSADSPSLEELAFQEELLRRLNSSSDPLKIKRDLGQMPGIVLAAAGPSQLASEAPWGGFSAGLFTYALTQHLWQATPPTTVQISLSRAAGVVEQLVGKEQQPQLSGQKSNERSLLAYNLSPNPTMGADGVVVAVEDNGKAAQVWLAGVPATVLEYYGINSQLTLVPLPGSSDQPLRLQIRSRDGLTAKAQLKSLEPEVKSQETLTQVPQSPQNSVQVGQLVQEAVRVLPRNIGLKIALDARLERIERVDATSAFANVACASSIVAAVDQPADYLFGNVRSQTTTDVAAAHTNLADTSVTAAPKAPVIALSQTGYGLFSLGRDPLPNTAGQAGEAVKVAVNRLVPKLKTLLAAKLWRLTVNEGSSRLGVRATLEMVSPQEQVLVLRETLRSPLVGASVPNQNMGTSQAGIPTLPVGSRIQYRIENEGKEPLYLMILGLDSSGSAIAFYPMQSQEVSATGETKTTFQEPRVEPQTTLILPQPSASFSWVISGPAGLAEMQLICSKAPFTQTMAALALSNPKRERVAELNNSLDVARALLQDLHDASANAIRERGAIASEATSTSSDTYSLDVATWATLSFIYQVV
ncbi:caspase family protein [Microcoleus sp. FACHB-831]|uniref:caspase family protein n=1 Tax=Microcoleus sp. FACHB-831 TaxID=2692827 RepID=UPI0016885535|nr:caspase family protein [Microcoleus sp. FACHB-831]MBD1922103.1 caspase family protein [Microcoleus sp. FACHB-831]